MATAAKIAPARNVAEGPRRLQSRPATTLASSKTTPVVRLNTPKAVPRRSDGAPAATGRRGCPLAALQAAQESRAALPGAAGLIWTPAGRAFGALVRASRKGFTVTRLPLAVPRGGPRRRSRADPRRLGRWHRACSDPAAPCRAAIPRWRNVDEEDCGGLAIHHAAHVACCVASRRWAAPALPPPVPSRNHSLRGSRVHLVFVYPGTPSRLYGSGW